MSVIWSGVTEEGAVVPVQVDETGKVIATAAVPGGDYVKKTGDNMTGDLTLGTDKIELNVDGSASFAGVVTAGSSTTDVGTSIFYGNRTQSALYAKNYGSGQSLLLEGASAAPVFQIDDSNGFNNESVVIKGDGSATFAGRIFGADAVVGSKDYTGPYSYVGPTEIALNLNQSSPVFKVTNDGSAEFVSGKCGFTFSGELFFTSRGARYKLVVQDQLCIAEPYTRQMELKEKAEQFIADKRETKPSDPDSDPSDPSSPQGGVTMDIDNSSPNRD